MIGSSLIRTFGSLRNLRGICNNTILRDATKPTVGGSTPKQNDSVLSGATQVPSNLEKRILVWTKRYPNVESIPKRVSVDMLQTATSKARIRMANYMMLMTVLACIYVIMSGKKAVKEKQSQAIDEHDEWRRQITAEYKASLQTEAAAKKT